MSKTKIISIQNEYGFILSVGHVVIPNPNAFAPIRENKQIVIQEFKNTTCGWCAVDNGTMIPINKLMPVTF